jgi:hypothetical protein
MKRKNIVFITVVLLSLMFVLAAESGPKLVNINPLDLSAKPKDLLPGSDGSDGNLKVVKPNIDFGKIPLYFVSNQGQVNEKAKFYAKASRYTLWMTKEGLVFDSFKKVKEGTERHTPPFGHPSQEGNNRIPHSPNSPYSTHSTHSPKLEREVSRLVFLDAKKNPEMVAIEEAKLRVNYFIGNDKTKWHCDVPTSMAVLYKSLYKHIDLKVYGIEKQIEYDWIVKPGGNPKDIRFEYKNVKGTRLDDEGNLLIETDFGELIHKKPVSYQEIRIVHSAKRSAQSEGVGAGLLTCPKHRRDINVTFKKIGKNTYGFEVGEYDRSRQLIIDPVVLAYSTYLGGVNTDFGYGIAVDGSGNAYVTGETDSMNFPTLDQYQEVFQGGRDVFVAKLDPSQSGAASLLYSTYLGGEGYEEGYGIAVDGSGNAYVTGVTGSTDFPTLHQYQTDQGTWDAFVAKLDPSQSGAASLLYSTYLGGGGQEGGQGIAVDGSGNAYVTGWTWSTDFPTLHQYQTAQGWDDVFVAKLDPSQSGAASLLYSTYLGGGDYDFGYGIAVDGSGNAYVTGETDSMDFPTLHQYQADQVSTDVFVAKLDPSQSGNASLLYSTYLGGGIWDYGYGIAVDGSGNAYVTGVTGSTDFPTLHQYQTDQGWDDVFVAKLDPSQSGNASLLYSTYLGGGDYDFGYGIAVDGSGNAYVTGYTWSTDFPTLDQFQADQENGDVFVAKLDPAQSGTASLLYSTYLGGGHWDYGYGIAVNGSGNAYVTGYTWGADFPTLHQYQLYQDFSDAFVTKLSVTTTGIIVTSPNGGEIWGIGTMQNITWTSSGLSGNIRIELWKANKKIGNIAVNIPIVNGNYPWVIGQYSPGTVPIGNDFWVKIITANVLYSDTSDGNFSIVNPSLTLTSPQGGENWQKGSQHNITWTSVGLTGNVKLILLKGGVKVGTIAQGIPVANGTYAWSTGKHSNGTAAAGSNYTVRIISTVNNLFQNTSGTFSIW